MRGRARRRARCRPGADDMAAGREVTVPRRGLCGGPAAGWEGAVTTPGGPRAGAWEANEDEAALGRPGCWGLHGQGPRSRIRETRGPVPGSGARQGSRRETEQGPDVALGNLNNGHVKKLHRTEDTGRKFTHGFGFLFPLKDIRP